MLPASEAPSIRHIHPIHTGMHRNRNPEKPATTRHLCDPVEVDGCRTDRLHGHSLARAHARAIRALAQRGCGLVHNADAVEDDVRATLL